MSVQDLSYRLVLRQDDLGPARDDSRGSSARLKPRPAAPEN
jgi:hypothetical protein